MTSLSVLTLVRNREPHLAQLVEGLRRSARAPDELIIVDMSDVPLSRPEARFPVSIIRLETTGLPLAQARNRAAEAARSDILVFLDVDCIPLHDCIGRLEEEVAGHDVLCCADVRYLARGDGSAGWTDAKLLSLGRRHPARDFPTEGRRLESNPGLFWSLAFAIRRMTFSSLGGFDEAFSGYGAEDTDFGFRADCASLPLVFVGGAIACHQYHKTFEPPVQHIADIVRNASVFYARWGFWPMHGWLRAFEALNLVEWNSGSLRLIRPPTASELSACLVGPAGPDHTRQIASPVTACPNLA